MPAGGRRAIEPFEGVLLHNRPIGSDDSKYRFAGIVRQRAEERRAHGARAQRARDDLGLRRRRYDVAVCQAAPINPADQGIGSSGQWQPGRIEDRG